MAETLHAMIEHTRDGGLARDVWECSIWETLDLTIRAQWVHREDTRKSLRHRWRDGKPLPVTTVPHWVRGMAADRIVASIRAVIQGLAVKP
jgi:hypothetical protein